MGFKRNKTFVLVFEDEDLAGLEVKARGATVAGMLGAVELLATFEGSGKLAGGMSAKDLAHFDRLFRTMAGCPAECLDQHDELPPGQDHYLNRLVSWNLEDEDDQPVPADYYGLMSQDADFAMTLVMAWMDGVLGTPGPLGRNSNDGMPPEGVSIPMETLPPVPQL